MFPCLSEGWISVQKKMLAQNPQPKKMREELI
jgi:hypothetical protein